MSANSSTDQFNYDELKYYKNSSDSGVPEAMIWLASYYQKTHKRDLALEYLQKAADTGNYTGKFHLAEFLYYQQAFYSLKVSDRDYTESAKLFEAAYPEVADSGYFAGLMYIYGLGVSENADKGMGMIKISAMNGSKNAQEFLEIYDGFIKYEFESRTQTSKPELYMRLYDSVISGEDLENTVLEFLRVTEGDPLNCYGQIAEYMLLHFFTVKVHDQGGTLFNLANSLEREEHYLCYSTDERDNEQTQKLYWKYYTFAGNASEKIARSCRKRFEFIGHSGDIFAYMQDIELCTVLSHQIIMSGQNSKLQTELLTEELSKTIEEVFKYTIPSEYSQDSLEHLDVLLRSWFEQYHKKGQAVDPIVLTGRIWYALVREKSYKLNRKDAKSSALFFNNDIEIWEEVVTEDAAVKKDIREYVAKMIRNVLSESDKKRGRTIVKRLAALLKISRRKNIFSLENEVIVGVDSVFLELLIGWLINPTPLLFIFHRFQSMIAINEYTGGQLSECLAALWGVLMYTRKDESKQAEDEFYRLLNDA